MIQAIAEARAQGDLSENAEYEAAKDKQGFIEGRILEIEGKLAAAQIIDPATLDADGRVVFGATVDLEDEDSGAKVTYQIVGDDEADLKLGLISISSPIARALIGKEAGDVAEVQAPGGSRATRSSRPLRVSGRSAATLLPGLGGRAAGIAASPRRRLCHAARPMPAGRGRMFAGGLPAWHRRRAVAERCSARVPSAAGSRSARAAGAGHGVCTVAGYFACSR